MAEVFFFKSSLFPFLFCLTLLEVFDIGFCSFGSFALSFLWVSSTIAHCFSASILAPPHEIVGGVLVYIAVDTLSTLGTHFILYLHLSSRRSQEDTYPNRQSGKESKIEMHAEQVLELLRFSW